MAIYRDAALFAGRFEARRADAPKNEGPAAHRADKSNNLGRFARKPSPYLRARHELENFRVVVIPKPSVLAWILSFCNREKAGARSQRDRAIHMANEEFRGRDGVCR